MKYSFILLLVMINCSKPIEQEVQLLQTDNQLPPLPKPIIPPNTSSLCPSDMVYIEGRYCPHVEQKCLKWLDQDTSLKANSGIGPMRCAEFSKPSKCLSSKKENKYFCMDRFEWPNKEGLYPIVDIDWYSASKNCELIHKRLCTDSEWTFACETEEMLPYPYGDGFHRDEEVCDQHHDSMNPSLPRSEWSKYYFAHPSGSFKNCKSKFGVFDMVSNVDEWVVNESGKPFISGLKGGYWTNKVRTRCRPMTEAHGPYHSFYQQGFRCCSKPSLNNEL